MAAEGATEKRANLVASKVMWSNRDDVPMSAPERSHGSDRAGLLKRNASSEDDLALGVEASLYGKQGVRTVQEFLRGSRSSPVLTRWNSLTSAFSAQSAPLSVMDVLNLWSDDPEEVLLDLGFGCDEPDISGRIPARFINNQSSARGINIQVFLDAQKNRMDIENPDVSNRFRQLEVLQQVTTAFSSLVGGASTDSLSESGVPALASAEAREKRKRMGMLLRRVSRKTLSQTQIQTQDSQDTNPTPHSPVAHLQQPLAGPPDRRTPLKRARQGLAESICLTPLVEEQGLASEAPEPHSVPQEGALRLEVGKEYQPLISSGIPTRKKSPGEARESFEMEEIQSFDEGSISGSYMGASDTTAVCVMRTNSCQSDSSGFLEEPFIPSITQHPSPGPELMKALSGISGGSTDSQITVKGASPPSSPPSTSLDPSPPSLSTCHPRPESPLYRPETTSPTEETPRHQDFPTPHSLLSDALEMTNSAFGARPSLMENTVTEEDGFSSACCAPCHKPDSPLRHVIIIMKTDRETEHFTLESEEAVPIEGEEKAIAEQSGNVQTGTEAVGDQDTDYMTPETISLPSPCPSPSMSSSNRWLSRDGSRRSGSFQMKSTSLDTGLWQEEVGEEVGDEDRRWERALFSGLSCCCSCDNRCRCCSQNNRLKPSSVSAFPYSLDELEGMMHCMRKFRCVLTDIEEQLSEDQASVYSSLSDTDREEVRDILELRKAVKQEAGELELQLTDLVHRYDDSFKMKMHRLLDEQSHLYTQLRLLPLIPTTTSTPGSASSRSMATQCCLLPWLPLTDMSRPRPSSQATWDLESRSALPDSSSMGQRLKHGSTGTKPDKLDIVGFIQRLKESIRHSVNTDSLE
ncbi:unnamed protein product [Oncorhynchus mykiss]|uniref:ITPR-interacting domain-containing protein n=1 Tax=Oncorhynchus mykiss TaxID=8022 RepID=A0A060WUC3_ONCMY|nr:unnamed protein product [Oncorhynchus mykiss]